MRTTVVNRHHTSIFDVYIGRGYGSKLGNPFSHVPTNAKAWSWLLRQWIPVEIVATREEAVRRYEEWIATQPGLVAYVKRELKGKVLACWCAPKLCHGDVLARIAEEL